MTAVIIILVVIVILAVVLFAGAARLKPTPIPDALPVSEARGDDASVERFREVLRIPTVWAAENPDADHAPFDRFVPRLRELYPAVFSQLHLTMVDTYGIMLEWPGADPTLQPVVLMGHHDVVVADPDAWTHDPFAAEIADGRIWARGALDNKPVFCGLLEAAETLLGEGYVPPRTIYICSGNCEEDNGDTAADMVRELQRRGVEPLFVLDEGGAVLEKAPFAADCPFAAIGVTEKGFVNAHITVNAAGGHASEPSPQDSTARLVAGLASLQADPAPSRLSAPVEALLTELASHGSFGIRIVFGNLWLFRPLVMRIMRSDPTTAAMVRSTYALTELEGSRAVNVLPEQAKANLNIRIDPAESVQVVADRALAHFEGDVDCELTTPNEPSPVSPFDDAVFAYLRNVVHSIYPQAGIGPYIQTSSSDSRHFARAFPRVYRFAGILYRNDQLSTIHGQDENIDVENFKRGVGFCTELIRHLDLLGNEG